MEIRKCQHAGCTPEISTWLGEHFVTCDCYDGPDDDGQVFQCHRGASEIEATQNWNDAQDEIADEMDDICRY